MLLASTLKSVKNSITSTTKRKSKFIERLRNHIIATKTFDQKEKCPKRKKNKALAQ